VGEEEPPRYLAPGEEVPPLSTRPRAIKLSAAWLIEQAGVRKGFALPGSGAGISTKHSLAITNRGTASADDVLQLAKYVQSMVQSTFGVLLLPEPTLVGLSL
jgi:UDP-N-acetylmuramate dehydrogenase